MTPRERVEAIQGKLPAEGLFAGQDWRVAPSPFLLDEPLVRELESLGRVLLQFNRACHRLYLQSVQGRQPAWVAELIDLGKPDELIAWQRNPGLKYEFPRVIRPDLLLTEGGMAVSELDSVPGGIGLTAWLNKTYSGLPGGERVIGGAEGMIDGFLGIFGEASPIHLVVSEESATYRPEMAWLSGQLKARGVDVRIELPAFATAEKGSAVYRFFELFDLAAVSGHRALFDSACTGSVRVTPPPKPLFEEKIWLALLWNRNLRTFWRQELGEGFLNRMLKLVPFGWVLDPTPLPPHAAYPRLDITDWQQLKALSQRERDLILKVSGYSEKAWGARGVYLGSDLPSADWSVAVDEALEHFSRSPYILQQYHKPRTVSFDWFDKASNTPITMPGRVRLCPYYFVVGDGDAARTQLGGVLATVCPADKKIIHGMKDAILAPCMV